MQFNQPDSIIPNLYNPQSLNRYSYALNNPVRYNDPTGHYVEGSQHKAWKYSKEYKISTWKQRIKNEFDITLSGTWEEQNLQAVYTAAAKVGGQSALTRGRGETAAEAFKASYDPITMVAVANYDYLGKPYDDGCKTEGSTITCADITYGYFQSTINNIVHEFGHVIDRGSGIPQIFIDNRGSILHDNDETGMWQQNAAHTPGETFGDFFLAWVFGVWGPEADTIWPNHEDVGSATDWMTTNMSDWLQP